MTSVPARTRAPLPGGGAGSGGMSTGPLLTGRAPTRAFRILVVAAVIATYLLIVAGGVVRVTGSGLGCGVTGQDWPLCHGRLVPPPDVSTLVEFSHRCLAFISTVLVALVTLVGWVRYRHLRQVVLGITTVAVLLVVQILLGAVTVELKLPGGIVLAHLANALLLLGVLIFVAVTVVVGPADRSRPRDPRRTAAARLMAVAAGATFLLVLSGALVVADGAGYACAGWPLCGGGFQIDTTHYAVINLAHRTVAGVVGLLIAYAVVRVVLAFRGERAVRLAATLVGVMLLAQVVAGAVLVELRLPPPTRSAHEAFASALWASAALLALLVRPGVLSGSRRRREREREEAPRAAATAGRSGAVAS